LTHHGRSSSSGAGISSLTSASFFT
jgi:hypothetical protein